MSSICDVAIVGAGPYGLSAAAHLRAAGVEARVFGRAMEFWERQMPAGMLLRSSWNACHISDPNHRLTLDDYQVNRGTTLGAPVPLDSFIAYGRWFKSHAAPDTDPRRVERIEPAGNGFRIALEDRESVGVKRVVIATGIARFAYKPREFNSLPCPLVSHSCEHRDLARFAGHKVIVVGGGQSAVESAALLRENGADVEVVMRAPAIRWLARSARLHRLPQGLRRLLYHPTDVGPGLLSQLVARPNLFRWLSRGVQDNIAYRSIRPAASAWLGPRTSDVRFTVARKISDVARCGDKVRLRLDDETTREVSHIILATGYRIDISRHCLLSPELLSSVSRINGYPELKPGLESSAAGLHFLGAPAAWSFGPLLRFVSGTDYASRALTKCVIGNLNHAQT